MCVCVCVRVRARVRVHVRVSKFGLAEPETAGGFGGVRVSMYKIVYHFKALLWESIIRLLPPPLQSLPDCNTIARPLRNKRLLPDAPLVSHTPYNVGRDNSL